MNPLEAMPLVIIYILVMALLLNNFLTTVGGYLSVIESRSNLLSDATVGEKVVPQPAAIDTQSIYKISPYSYCGDERTRAYLANGYIGLTIDVGGGYYLLIPSPNYYRHGAGGDGPKNLSCIKPLHVEAASAFYIFPNGSVIRR